MTYRFILATLVSTWLFAACNSEPVQEEPELEATEPTQPPKPQNEDYTISYEEKLTGGGMNFVVRTLGLGSQRSLSITVEREEQLPTHINEPIEGAVTRSIVTDLNKNKKPELLVFVSGSGSGSYGKIYGYEFERKYWGELTLPALPPELKKDYMGHDEFKVTNNSLVRTFPVYLETDPNCCPTGGWHTVIYKLDNALNFLVEKVK